MGADLSPGRCLCGAASFVGKGTPSAVHVCHCNMCQRWHGGPALGVEFEQGIEIDGEVSWFVSSEWGERGFCPKCGSTLFFRLRDQSYINTAIGFLDDPNAIAPIAMEISVEEKPTCYDFAGTTQKRFTSAEFSDWLKDQTS